MLLFHLKFQMFVRTNGCGMKFVALCLAGVWIYTVCVSSCLGRGFKPSRKCFDVKTLVLLT